MLSATGRPTGFWGLLQLACLTLFAAITLGRTIDLLVRHRVNPITLHPKKGGLQGVAELALVVNVSLWAVAVVLRSLGRNVPSLHWLIGAQLFDSSLLKGAGLVLVALAFAILILAQVALGKSWRLGIDEERPGELVTTGIYALTRNPIYLFFDLYFLGTFLINSGLFFALSSVFTVLNLHYQILNEERHLARIHGSAYREYCARTARYCIGLRTLSRRMRRHQKTQEADTA